MQPTTNHRAVVTRHGGPEVLQFVEADRPEPGPGEVRVAVEAAGVSAFDLIYRRWAHLPGSLKVPFALGEDIVGVVDELGPGVTSLEVGQRVAGGTWSLGVGGGYAEAVCLSEGELVPVPAGLDPAVAVCLVVNYLTAYLHLHRFGEARRDQRLLVHGAAGGVGSATLELGRRTGLEMYGTASAENHDDVAALGATPIDYRRDDFVERIQDLTDDGVDLVIDTVGGWTQLWRSYRTLRGGGRLVWLGSAGTHKDGLRTGLLSLLLAPLLRIVPDGKHMARTTDLGKFALDHGDWYRRTLAELLDLAARGELQPIVAERIPLAEAARAHALLERGGHAGKIVLVTGAAGASNVFRESVGAAAH